MPKTRRRRIDKVPVERVERLPLWLPGCRGQEIEDGGGWKMPGRAGFVQGKAGFLDARVFTGRVKGGTDITIYFQGNMLETFRWLRDNLDHLVEVAQELGV